MRELPSQSKRIWLWWPTLLALPALLCLIGCDRQGLQALPAEMAGVWRTDEPRYQGRFMKLEADRITFGLGGVASDKAEHIEKIKIAPDETPTVYTIQLKAGDGSADSVALLFTPQNGGELRLKSQPKVVWKRRSEPQRTMPKEAPEPSLHDTPRHETSPSPEHKFKEHVTIYKIDCLKPEVCHSY